MWLHGAMVSPQATSLTPGTYSYSNAAPGASEQPREHPQAERTRTKARVAWTVVSTPIRGDSSKLQKRRWGTHNQRPGVIGYYYLAPTPRPPSPHSSAQQQRSALPVATPALCAVLLCRAVSTKARHARAQRNKKTHTAVCCVHFQKTATQTKQTNAVSEVTHGCSVAVLGPAVAVAAPSRNAV